MAISYAVSKALTTFGTGYKATGPVAGIYTYTQKRGFIPFDLSAAGISPSSVQTAELLVKCTSVVGGSADLTLRSAVDPDGFGSTLDGTHDDWASTATILEDTVTISGTGWYTFNVAPSSLSASGWTYFRLRCDEEGSPAVSNFTATFNSSNAGTPSNRPILRLTLFSGQIICVQAM